MTYKNKYRQLLLIGSNRFALFHSFFNQIMTITWKVFNEYRPIYMGVWEGVAMDSLKVHPGLPFYTLPEDHP
jgi:hypothetical protein